MFQIPCTLRVLMVMLLHCTSGQFFNSSLTRADLTPMEFLLQTIEQASDNDKPVVTPYNILSQEIRDEYDFVVVGTGPAGATIGNRLSEVDEFSVLLLEAGSNVTILNDIPIAAGYFQQTPYKWNYRTEPQNNACLGLNDRRCLWPRGKGLGGSSVLNYMIYTRGHRRDYDEWRKLGNRGWAWRDVFKYFKKSEIAKGYFDDSPCHGKDGYLNIEDPAYQTPLGKVFLQSMVESGFPLIDYNCGHLIGFSFLQTTMRNGTRCSASKAFINPVLHRRNLNVVTKAHVTRVKIDPKTKRALGVYFYRDGRRRFVRAKREVILSAGAINSPQLLLLSGIGPKEHLDSVGINTIVDLPGVGRNLQDHVTYNGLAIRINSNVALVEKRLAFNIQNYYEYLTQKTGPFTIPGGVEGLGFIRTSISETPDDYPDIEFMFNSASIASDDGRIIRRNIGLTDENYNAVYTPINSMDTISIWPMLLQPKSQGYIKLRSRNPFDQPIMDGNYFSDDHDLNTMVEGIKYAVKLIKTKAFRRLNIRLHDIPLPSCKNYTFASDPYWACAVRQMASTVHHQCGTAKMGPSSDPMAVVDPMLRVYGIPNLRVVDASVMPKIPTAHTSGPTYMIAENAADMIKKTYNKL